jgi:Putative zinc-finger
MYSCQQCRNLLWDHLFGLLEDTESRTFSAHLLECTECQSALAQARTQQRWLVEAARLDVEIPPFTAPVAAPATPILDLAPLLAARRIRRPLLSYGAIAAALLVSLGIPTALYRVAINDQIAQAIKLERDAEGLLAERDAVRLDSSTALETVRKSLNARFVRVEVDGPAGYHPGQPSLYRLRTSDMDGKPGGKATVPVVDEAQRVLFEKSENTSQGEKSFELPATLEVTPERPAKLEIAARAGGDEEKLAIPIRVAPSYIAYLALDRERYAPGESLYFSAHILDRFGLRVPKRIFQPLFTIKSSENTSVAALRCQSNPAAIAGGSWDLPPTLAEGQYTLTVSDPEGRFEPLTRQFLVRKNGTSPIAPLSTAKAAGKPGRQDSELALVSIPKRVVTSGEDIRVSVAGTNTDKRLLLQLLCRGQLTAQEVVTATAAGRTVALHPGGDAAGLMQLMVYAGPRGEERKLAERLVFVRPSKWLKVATASDHSVHHPGEKVHISLHSENERGQLEAARLQVSVTEMDTGSSNTKSTLQAQCYFWSELEPGAQTESIEAILSDTPQANARLQQFLQSRDFDTPFAVRQDRLVQLSNSVQVERKYRKALAMALADTRAHLDDRIQSLASSGHSLLEEIRQGWQRVEKARNRYVTGLATIPLISLAGFTMVLVYRRRRIVTGLRPQLTFGFGLAAAFSLVAATTLAPRGSVANLSQLEARLDAPEGLPSLAMRDQGNAPFIGVIQAPPVPATLLQPPQNIVRAQGPTLVWAPAVFADKGSAEITFRLPAYPASYRIRVEAHSPAGRIGEYESVLRSE